MHDAEADYQPQPERAERDFQKIGEFFCAFSFLEDWISAYIKEHVQCDGLTNLNFASQVEIWILVANAAQPNDRRIQETYCLLKEVSKARNLIAHARWHEDLTRGQLHGTDRKRKKKSMSSHDISEMLNKTRRCQAIMEFWI